MESILFARITYDGNLFYFIVAFNLKNRFSLFVTRPDIIMTFSTADQSR